MIVPRRAHAMLDALECEMIQIVVRCTGRRVSKDERQFQWTPTHSFGELLEALTDCSDYEHEAEQEPEVPILCFGLDMISHLKCNMYAEIRMGAMERRGGRCDHGKVHMCPSRSVMGLMVAPRQGLARETRWNETSVIPYHFRITCRSLSNLGLG